MKKGLVFIDYFVIFCIVCFVAGLAFIKYNKVHEQQIFVSRLQQTYNVVIDVMPSYLYKSKVSVLYDTSAFNIWINENGIRDMEDFLKTYFDVKRICLLGSLGGLELCKGKIYSNMDGTNYNKFGGSACAVLKIGSTICFDRMENFEDIPHLYIDVNGPDGPNVWGRDAFRLEIDNYGRVAENFSSRDKDKYKAERCKISSCGAGCFNRIIAKGWVMDY